MIVTIHQPEHLPWLGFFHKMRRADRFVILDNVQYRTNYFQNRNRVLGANGPFWLTVPVRSRGHVASSIADIVIDDSQAWGERHRKSLEACYGRHPHFRRYADVLRTILESPWQRLADLNLAIIEAFRSALDIGTPMVRASELGVEGRGSELLLAICERMGAATYLSGPSGRDYLDESLFANRGIAVQYHEFHHPVYPQRGANEFVSHLTALDALANLGPEAVGLT
jgi:hypothetical protein